MKGVILLLIVALFGGVAFYVWDHNKIVEAEAASNNGATCYINIQLDEELFDLWQRGDQVGAILGNLETMQSNGSTTTTATVTTKPSDVLVDLQQRVAELSVIAGADCIPYVTQFPAMTPGRVRMDISYFRPYPAGQTP